MIRSSTVPSALATVALCLALAGCATTTSRSDPFGGGFAPEGVRLTVDNQNFRDANVYVYWNGVRDRVGMVIGKTKKTFEMDWRSEEVRIRVDFVGGGGHFSETVAVWDGDHLEYIIRPTAG